MVRPWGLSAPVAVLLICLPLMRPLRHPDPRAISDDEQARLATIEALVEHHTLAINSTEFRTTRCLIVQTGDRWYSDQSPVMSVLLSGPYWVMHRCGLSFENDPVMTEYLLTLFGVTLPVAFAAGLLYRMGRIFELRRPVRAGLALAVVLGSGWISYATVLSAGAAAAALVIMATAALVQATLSRTRVAAFLWVAMAGLCAALAVTYDLTAIVFLFFLLVVIGAVRWSAQARTAASGLYALGAAAPLLLYVGLNVPITGDVRPGFLHPELCPAVVDLPTKPDVRARLLEEDDDPPTVWRSINRATGRFFSAFLGSHGLLTHFPVLLLGLAGVSMVMHRHWPATTKVLAASTVIAGLVIVIGFTALQPSLKDAMFGNRWFLVFLPLTLFWAGAWLRKPHRAGTWVLAAVLLAFSTVIALIGATDPQPRQGYDRYTAAGAFMHLVYPPQPARPGDVLAVRESGD